MSRSAVTVLRGNVERLDRSALHGTARNGWSRLRIGGEYVFCGPDLLLGADSDATAHNQAVQRLLEPDASSDVVVGVMREGGRWLALWMLVGGRSRFAPMDPLERSKSALQGFASGLLLGFLALWMFGHGQAVLDATGGIVIVLWLLVSGVVGLAGVIVFIFAGSRLLPWPGPRRWAAWRAYRRALAERGAGAS